MCQSGAGKVPANFSPYNKVKREGAEKCPKSGATSMIRGLSGLPEAMVKIPFRAANQFTEREPVDAYHTDRRIVNKVTF